MTTGIPTRYFEDFEVGQTFEFGDYSVSEGEIIDFGRAYDPQPFHVNAKPPKNGGSHELIASGWHTGAMTMRMIVEHFIPQATILPSPGHERLSWPRPVTPNDRLRVRMVVVATRASQTKPDRGVVTFKIETLNQRDEVVQEIISPNFFRRRIAAAS